MNCKKHLLNCIANHGSSVFCGIKAANLIIIFKNQQTEWRNIFFETLKEIRELGIETKILKENQERIWLFIYRQKDLFTILRKPSTLQFLAGHGYQSRDPENLLSELAERLKNDTHFPHEIGIFLDYPLEDVIGFIDHCGRCEKMCGYWKVYGDIAKAKMLFQSIDQSRVRILSELNLGKPLAEVVTAYRA